MDPTQQDSITSFVGSLANAYATVQNARATVPVGNTPAGAYISTSTQGMPIASYLSNPLVLGLGVILVGLVAWKALGKKG